MNQYEITSIERSMDSLGQEWITATFADGLHAYGTITAGRQGGVLHIEGFANSKWEARYNAYGHGEGWTISCGRFGGNDFSDETLKTLARALREFCCPEVCWEADGRRLETSTGDVIYELRPDERLNDNDREAVSIMMSGLKRDGVAVEKMRSCAAAIVEMYVREAATA